MAHTIISTCTSCGQILAKVRKELGEGYAKVGSSSVARNMISWCILIALSYRCVGVTSFSHCRRLPVSVLSTTRVKSKLIWMSNRISSSFTKVAGFDLERYLNEHLICSNKISVDSNSDSNQDINKDNREVDRSSIMSIQFTQALPKSIFDESKQYLLLVDIGVRTVSDIDLPYLTDYYPFLKRLLKKIKSSGLHLFYSCFRLLRIYTYIYIYIYIYVGIYMYIFP